MRLPPLQRHHHHKWSPPPFYWPKRCKNASFGCMVCFSFYLFIYHSFFYFRSLKHVYRHCHVTTTTSNAPDLFIGPNNARPDCLGSWYIFCLICSFIIHFFYYRSMRRPNRHCHVTTATCDAPIMSMAQTMPERIIWAHGMFFVPILFNYHSFFYYRSPKRASLLCHVTTTANDTPHLFIGPNDARMHCLGP
jgi:hypothetical protein